jgi:hypothetical protein
VVLALVARVVVVEREVVVVVVWAIVTPALPATRPATNSAGTAFAHFVLMPDSLFSGAVLRSFPATLS